MRYQDKCLGTISFMGGVPAVLTDFAWSLTNLVQFNAECLCGPGEYIHYDRAALSFHAAARNSLVDRMRGDWLLMIDSDHKFDPDLCYRMLDRLNRANIDVLTGIYQFKNPPYSPVLYLSEGEYFSPLGSWRPANGGVLDIFPVAASGAGCLMVRRRVFERIRDELNEGPFDIIPPFGEDMSFAKRLQRLNISLYCDARIECHHLTIRPVTLADYDRESLEIGPERAVNALALVPVRGE